MLASAGARLGRLLGIGTSALLYATLFAPFGLLGRTLGIKAGWRRPPDRGPRGAALRRPG
jgi:hypothetical protein